MCLSWAVHWRWVKISKTWVQKFVRLQWKIFEISATRGISSYLLTTLNLLDNQEWTESRYPWPKAWRGKICYAGQARSGEGETKTQLQFWTTDRENGKSGQRTLRYPTGTKIKFVGDRAGDQFPSLQGKCTSGKSGLTRSLNSLDAAVEAFSNMEETETLLTKQRRARAIMECVDKVESKKESLETAFEDLITHIHGMESTSFNPATDPYDMAQSVELTINQST